MTRHGHRQTGSFRPNLSVLELEDRSLPSGLPLLSAGLVGPATSLLGNLTAPTPASQTGSSLLNVVTRDVGQVVASVGQTVSSLAPAVGSAPLGNVLVPVVHDVGSVVGGLAPVVTDLGNVVGSAAPPVNTLPLGNVVSPVLVAVTPGNVVGPVLAAVPQVGAAVPGVVAPVTDTVAAPTSPVPAPPAPAAGPALPAAAPSITASQVDATTESTPVVNPPTMATPAAPAATVPTAGVPTAEYDAASAVAVVGLVRTSGDALASVFSLALVPRLPAGLAGGGTTADTPAGNAAIVPAPGLAGAAEAPAAVPDAPPAAGDEPLADRFQLDLSGLVPAPGAVVRAFEGLAERLGSSGASVWLAWLAAAALAAGAGEVARRQLRLRPTTAGSLLPPEWLPEEDGRF